MARWRCRRCLSATAGGFLVKLKLFTDITSQVKRFRFSFK
jgi:hypothetical protein